MTSSWRSIGAAAVVFLAACARPDMVLRAPARIEQALSVATELEATATLIAKGGHAQNASELTRGDDGVTFSGFIAAAPGEYTLEVVFTGLVGGRRHFLGRLTSDAFTVAQGATATPAFSRPVDTVGRAGDGGDDDDDGLGFLDELLVGADPAKADSDGDGVKDGQDCKPTDPGDAFVVADGGSFDDCDGDGYDSITALLGKPGLDCNDEEPVVNPGVHDDCTNTIDEDCNPQTCPVNDVDGPVVSIETPADGASIGCNTPFVVHATDASDVANVLLTAPDDPLTGGTQRTIVAVADDDFVTWRAVDGFGYLGAVDDGSFAVDATAFDHRGNQTTVHASYNLTSAYPDVTLTGPDSIVAGSSAHITVSPTGPRPLASLELHFAAYNPGTFQLDLDTEASLGALPVGGGSLDVDPAALPANAVVFPVAVDDIGNTASPLYLGASYSPSLGINSGFFCDGVQHYVPAIAKRADIGGPVTVLAHLQEATAAAQAIAPSAFLTQVNAYGIEADGTIDLSRTDDSSVMIIYGFMTPEAVQSQGSNAEGPAVYWFSAATAGLPVPYVDPTATFLTDEIRSPSTLIDSDAIVAAYACGGPAFDGSTNSYISYDRDVDGAIPNIDEVQLRPNDTDFSWTTNAHNLNDANGFCCTPTGCT